MNIDYDMWRHLMLMGYTRSTPKMFGIYRNSLKAKRRGGIKRK